MHYFLLTRGRVSTTYIKILFGLVLRTQFNSCSSSRHRALNPERGWLQRHIAACKHNGTKIIRTQLRMSYLHYILKAVQMHQYRTYLGCPSKMEKKEYLVTNKYSFIHSTGTCRMRQFLAFLAVLRS